MTDNDIIAGWLVKHGKTTSEYMLRLKRDGEVFLGPNGFIEPEDISAVNVEDDPHSRISCEFKAKDTLSEGIRDVAVKCSDEISLDDIEARANVWLYPEYEDFLNEEIESGRIPPSFSDMKEMSEAGLRGAAAGRKLAEAVSEIGEASKRAADAGYKLGVTINMSIPHNPGRIKRFFRWILAKIRGDIPTSYIDSSGNIYRGWAKCGEIKKLEGDSDEKRWYKPWTWEFFRMLGKPKVMKVETRFRGDKS